MRQVIEYCRRHTLALSLIAIGVGMALHALTMPYSPVHWIDDVMINETARGGILSKDADWSMVWFPDAARNQKSWAITYLGGWMLESGYQLFGHLGPRFLTMGWLLILTGLVTFYFHRKLRGWGVSCLLGLITFAFPGLVQSARGARVDVMAIALIFAALALLQLGGKTLGRRMLAFAGCGICSALAFFTWQPAAMLYPIVLWEVVELFVARKTSGREIFVQLAVAAFAFIVTVVLMMYPFWDNFLGRLFGAGNTVGKMASSSQEAGWHWGEFAHALKELPWVYPLGFAALFLRKRVWPLALVLVGLSLLCIATKVYVFRMIYLLPYALVGLGVYLASASWRMRKLGVGVLALMALAAFGWSVGLRTATEYFARDFRDYEKMRRTLEAELGRDVSVYQCVYQAYYIGRELGWRQYHIERGADTAEAKALIERLDYVLLEEKWVNEKELEHWRQYGFDSSRLICTDIKKPSTKVECFLSDRKRLNPYGPFRLLWRESVK